jgi:hypothetical protein
MNDDLDSLFESVLEEDSAPAGSGYNDGPEMLPAAVRVNPENSAGSETAGEIFQDVQREGYRWAQDCSQRIVQ